MGFCFFHDGGRVWVMLGGGRERGKKHFKNLLLPCLCIRRGEEHAQCHLKWHRVMLFSLFFFFERNEFENNPKISYDSYPSLYNTNEAKILRSKFCKDKQN